MTARKRVVLDTNIVLSALLFRRGRLAPLRLAWQQATFDPLASKATTLELILTLTYPKFQLSGEEQQEMLADYLPYCTTIVMPAKVPGIQCRDPFDVPFLELAIVGKANCLVRGDQDLLHLAGEGPCPIMTAAEFLTSLNKT
jgi:putative PIN family toxin of toxin-antitoxin system